MTIAVVVTYNPERDLLETQQRSLLHQVDSIIYVDNGSTESRPEFGNNGIHVIQNKENKGLGYAQNQGITKALELDADHILLLDQDSEPAGDMVECLMQTEKQLTSEGMKVGAVSPALTSAFDPSLQCYGTTSIGFVCKKEIPGEKPMELAYCIASGTLIKSEVIREVGLMNQDMFIDGIDLEWCLRAKHKGYRIFMTPGARLIHRLGNGSKDVIISHSPTREYYICRNNMILAKLNHIPAGYRLRKIVTTPMRIAQAFCKGHRKHAVAGFKGFMHGFRKKNNN